jgi:hypothetical protein
VVLHCLENRGTARGVLESCTKDDFLAWYACWKDAVTGVDVDVPSPFDVETETDMGLASAMAVAGID